MQKIDLPNLEKRITENCVNFYYLLISIDFRGRLWATCKQNIKSKSDLKFTLNFIEKGYKNNLAKLATFFFPQNTHWVLNYGLRNYPSEDLKSSKSKKLLKNTDFQKPIL